MLVTTGVLTFATFHFRVARDAAPQRDTRSRTGTSVPCGIARLDGPHAHGKRAADERIINE
jgi:hypothetical protein